MKTIPFLSNLNIILCILSSTVSCLPMRPHLKTPAPNYVIKSCQTTLYPDLCNKTLAKYGKRIGSSPKVLAMTALVVTFNATRTTSKVLRRLRDKSEGLMECVEVVSDAVYELHRSIKEMNQSRRGPQFYLQMDDVQTWVSAALTDDDTCMDDFTATGNIKILVRRFVLTIARLTSIALTFINSYAAAV